MSISLGSILSVAPQPWGNKRKGAAPKPWRARKTRKASPSLEKKEPGGRITVPGSQSLLSK